MDEVELRGLRIAYQRRGEGPPLVLLHGGFGFDSRSWSRQVVSFSDEFTVVAWDAPGSGRSSDPPETFRLPDYADCLADFISALDLASPHVVGLSSGAALALALYDRHPDVPRTLVLAGAYAGWAGSLPSEVVEERLQRALREQHMAPEEWVPGYIPGMLTADAPQEMVDEAMALMCDVHPAANVTALRAIAEADLRDVLPPGKGADLLVVRRGGQAFPGERRRATLRAHTRCDARRPAGGRHLCNVEAADRFNREVRAFLHEHQQ